MSWQGIEGQDAAVDRFRTALSLGRMASTFLFVGPDGIGKRTFALKLAETLLCHEHPPQQMAPCGKCDSCKQVRAATHPDLLQVAKPKDKSELPLELLIGSDEKRMREGLCYELGLKPMMGQRKVAIVCDADALNVEGANSLLKTLEEPPPHAVLILIGTNPERQLPTIRSRCQTIRFRPLEPAVLASLLISTGQVEDPAEARRLAQYGEGSLVRAMELSDADLWKFRRRLLEHAAAPGRRSVAMAQELTEFVDLAGKEAPARRNRLRQLIGFAAEFYREMLRAQCGAEIRDDAELVSVIRQALPDWPHDPEWTASAAERCLEALAHVDRSVYQAHVIESWLDDLAEMSRVGYAG